MLDNRFASYYAAFLRDMVYGEAQILGRRSIIGRHSADHSQNFGNRVFAVCGKLVSVSLYVGAYDLPGQRYNLGWIVIRSDDVQVVHMAHEGLIARAAGVGKFGA